MQKLSFFYSCTKEVKIFTFLSMLLIGSSYIHTTSAADAAPLVNKSSTIDKQLIWAIQENNLRKISQLLIDKKNINSKDFLGYTPLHYAAKYANKAVVACLIAANPLLNQVSVKNGNTPLLLAVFRGHKEIVSLLLEAGADPNIVNHKGYNALQLAIQQNRKDLVQLLLAAGATSRSGPSPLLMAIKARSLPIVRLLLQQKEIVTDQDQTGYSALHWSAKQNALPILRALLKSGRFDVNAKANNGATPLHLIVAGRKTKLLKTLLNCPLLQINVQDSTGSTPLHYAVATNQPKVVDRLLSSTSIDVNIQNNIGKTALHYAVQYQHIAIVKKLLLRAGKGVLIKNKEGVTPLQMAMHQNNPKIYSLILAHINLIGVDHHA